jgi:hypothetical protein
MATPETPEAAIELDVSIMLVISSNLLLPVTCVVRYNTS